MMTKKIAWVSADYFTDTDLNFDLFKSLSKKYEVYWFILEGSRPYFSHDAFSEISQLENINVVFLKNPYRTRDPRCLFYYFRLMVKIRKLHVDYVYYNVAPNPASAITIRLLSKDKVFFTAHDGKAQNDSSKFGFIRSLSYNLTYNFAENIVMFSRSQATLFHNTYGNKNVTIVRLPLKNFGSVVDHKPTNIIRFLSFGHIIYQKNIDLLIKAGNILYERGWKNIRISINGTCTDWNYYQNLIKYPDIFECNPNFITNDKLLELFSTSHYVVFPYRRVSQSGVLKLAFNYNLPVIVSNIGSFKEEVVENINGFFFQVSNEVSLADVMEQRILNFDNEYSCLRNKMQDYIATNYTVENTISSFHNIFK